MKAEIISTLKSIKQTICQFKNWIIKYATYVQKLSFEYRWTFVVPSLFIFTFFWLNFLVSTFTGTALLRPTIKAINVVRCADILEKPSRDLLQSLPWTTIATFVAAPWFLFLWFLRDYTKQHDLRIREKELRQSEFHELLKRASDFENIPLQLSSIYMLEVYFKGHSLSSEEIAKNPYVQPIIRLVGVLRNEIIEKEGKEKQECKPLDEAIKELFISPEVLKYLKTVDLRDMIFTDIDFTDFDLSEFKLGRSKFTNSLLNGSNLKKAELWAVNFEEASLKEADLSEADVSSASFIGADLTGANFERASLQETELSKVKSFKGIKLIKAKYSEGTKFPENLDKEEHGLVKVMRNVDAPGWVYANAHIWISDLLAYEEELRENWKDNEGKYELEEIEAGKGKVLKLFTVFKDGKLKNCAIRRKIEGVKKNQLVIATVKVKGDEGKLGRIFIGDPNPSGNRRVKTIWCNGKWQTLEVKLTRLSEDYEFYLYLYARWPKAKNDDWIHYKDLEVRIYNPI